MPDSNGKTLLILEEIHRDVRELRTDVKAVKEEVSKKVDRSELKLVKEQVLKNRDEIKDAKKDQTTWNRFVGSLSILAAATAAYFGFTK